MFSEPEILKFVYPTQPVDHACQTQIELLEEIFQGSSTSLNRTHMSVGVYLEGENIKEGADVCQIYGSIYQDKAQHDASVCLCCLL